MALLIPKAIAQTVDLPHAYIQNEDSHPHQVHPGKTARFYLESSQVAGQMNVKCSLEGDDGRPLTAVTLRTHGLTDVQWPFPTRTIRVDKKVDFDISAQTQPTTANPPYFEFANQDQARLLWHQCYNN